MYVKGTFKHTNGVYIIMQVTSFTYSPCVPETDSLAASFISPSPLDLK